jgi:hypothetical protein
MFRHLISIAVCILVASAASAQMDKNDTPDHLDLLRGLKTINLVIEGADDDAQRCGITESLIRDAFLYPISQSKLQFSTIAHGTAFLVRVAVLILALFRSTATSDDP